MYRKHHKGKETSKKMKNQYYDGECYYKYRYYWIEKNFPDRFRKYKHKIYEIEIKEA